MSTPSDYQSQVVCHWNDLHRQPRFRPQFPNEHVIRFLMRNFPLAETSMVRALDIGLGAGRHTKLLCELGFQTAGVDISDEGVAYCQQWLRSLSYEATLRVAPMGSLPFADGAFDVALSIGVYYYTDRAGMAQAVAELHRVLAPDGLALVITRTTADYRFGKGVPVESNTFRLDVDETNERDMLVHFLAEADVPKVFAAFSDVQFEKAEFTMNHRRVLNSDWLITVRK